MLVLVGAVVGLARSGAAGPGRVARIGLVAVGLGWATVAAAQVVSQARGEDYPLLFVVATALHVLGMLPVGVAVARAGWGVCWLALAVVLLRPVGMSRRQGVRP